MKTGFLEATFLNATKATNNLWGKIESQSKNTREVYKDRVEFMHKREEILNMRKRKTGIQKSQLLVQYNK